MFANVCTIELRHCRYAQSASPASSSAGSSSSSGGGGGGGGAATTAAAADGARRSSSSSSSRDVLLHGKIFAPGANTKAAAVSVLAECAVVRREEYCRHLNPAKQAASAQGTAVRRRRSSGPSRGQQHGDGIDGNGDGSGSGDGGGGGGDNDVDDGLYIVVNNAEDLELRRVLVKVRGRSADDRSGKTRKTTKKRATGSHQ